ncbi:MAG: aminotransferase class IV [Alphaproteobacteria bacterium]|nr:aminotransferase class IV [Alphaproteobacteria bacterium]
MDDKGAQSYQGDERNARVLIWLNGRLVPREQAMVSVFDSGFVLGDGVWEGFRQVRGRIIFADAHIDRLFEGATAIDLDIGMTREQIKEALDETCRANDMTDGVHIRMMVTRGPKHAPNQDPRHATGKPTIVIIAERKLPNPAVKREGMVLFTSTIRCSPPDMFDLRLNSHSRLNLIQALIQAIKAGAHEALMLDPHGFVASGNSTNFFIVRRGRVITSTGRYNFKGITRGNVIDLCRANDIPVAETDFTLTETYSAEEAFVTGTFGGVTPVAMIDGRRIGAGSLPGPVTARLDALYQALVQSPAAG